MESVSYYLADDKLPPKGRRGCFVILGPPPFSGTGEARNLKFGAWMEYVTTSLPRTNYHQKERDPGHVTDCEK